LIQFGNRSPNANCRTWNKKNNDAKSNIVQERTPRPSAAHQTLYTSKLKCSVQALCRFGRVVSKGHEAGNDQLENLYNYQVDTRKDAVVWPR
jgi:hypothetical protein